jgi:hypothetical protein
MGRARGILPFSSDQTRISQRASHHISITPPTTTTTTPHTSHFTPRPCSSQVLTQQLKRLKTQLHRDDVSLVFQQALLAAMRTRTQSTLDCVTRLLEAGATPGAIRFNALCSDAALGRFTRVNLLDLHDKLIAKLGVYKVRAPCHLPSPHTAQPLPSRQDGPLDIYRYRYRRRQRTAVPRSSHCCAVPPSLACSLSLLLPHVHPQPPLCLRS